MERKPILYVMVGVQGAGKSTFAKSHPECVRVCLDDIREEIFGDASVQRDGDKVFNIGRQLIKTALAQGHDVIYDATNATRRYRRWCLALPVEHIAVFVNTPLEECKRRNANRDRVVPEEVLDRTYAKLQKPTVEEGFDSVIVIS